MSTDGGLGKSVQMGQSDENRKTLWSELMRTLFGLPKDVVDRYFCSDCIP